MNCRPLGPEDGPAWEHGDRTVELCGRQRRLGKGEGDGLRPWIAGLFAAGRVLSSLGDFSYAVGDDPPLEVVGYSRPSLPGLRGSEGDGLEAHPTKRHRGLSAGAVGLTSGLDELDGTGCPKRPNQWHIPC